ncbi:MAG TPA: phage tail sheath C-terminal domain-containing protein [Gammaproteobacteria bacterium]
MRNGFDLSLPGVYFQAETPLQSPDLPRMDVAAFVGFAEKGPLDIPVAVETVKQFRDIFGEDIDLAWDAKRNRFQQSLLGGSVESFFDNGGRRCMVVRVADRDSENPAVLESRRFEIPGLGLIDEGKSSAGVLYARAPGSWSDTLRVAGKLNTTMLPLDFSGATGGDYEYIFSTTAGITQLRVKSIPPRLRRNDLLELSFNDIQLKAYIFVQDFLNDEFGLKILAHEIYWLALPDADADPASAPELLSEAEGFARVKTLFSDGGQPDLSLKFLSMTLLAWNNGVLAGRMDELAFHGEHPRFWQKLPSDNLLYGEILGGRLPDMDPEAAEFVLDTANPRFPLAGAFIRLLTRERQTGELRSLPLSMKESVNAEDAAEPLPLTGSAGAMTHSQRNGLESFNAGLFIDSDLADIRQDNLRAEAEYKKIRYMELLQKRDDGVSDGSILEQELERFRLKGMHSLYFENEVSMIAAPDAVHRDWNNNPPEFSVPLPPPQLEPPEYDSAGNWIEVSWQEIADATGYIIEQRIEPGAAEGVFHEVKGVDRLALTDSESPPSPVLRTYRISVSAGCRRTHTFRLYATGYDQRSPWSNARKIVVPQVDFHDCNGANPAALGLTLGFATGVGESEGVALSWMDEDEHSRAEVLSDSFELQRALDIDFVSAVGTVIDAVSGNAHVDEYTSDAVVYYRIRAISNNVAGPWSNTVYVEPERLSKLQLVERDEYRDAGMLAVHTALMRLCASRGDVIALLGLPEHFRDNQAIFAAQALKPSLQSAMGLARRFDDGSVSVPALNAGEAGAPKHAALFHPWLILSNLHAKSSDRRIANNRNLPGLGAVCGRLAVEANTRGAWISAANKVFLNVLGAVSEVTASSFSLLTRQQINVLWRDSRGYFAATMDTLGTGSEFRSLSVRRLFDLLVRIIRRDGAQHVFEPNSEDFRNRIQHFWDRLLSRLYQRGALRGRTTSEAYQVITGSALNTPQTQDQGRFYVELRVAPAQPMRFIRVLLKQSNPDNIVLEEL